MTIVEYRDVEFYFLLYCVFIFHMKPSQSKKKKKNRFFSYYTAYSQTKNSVILVRKNSFIISLEG